MMPLLLTVPQAAAALGLSRATFYRLIQAGQLKTVKIGGRRLVPPSSLEGYVARLVAEAA